MSTLFPDEKPRILHTSFAAAMQSGAPLDASRHFSVAGDDAGFGDAGDGVRGILGAIRRGFRGKPRLAAEILDTPAGVLEAGIDELDLLAEPAGGGGEKTRALLRLRARRLRGLLRQRQCGDHYERGRKQAGARSMRRWPLGVAG